MNCVSRVSLSGNRCAWLGLQLVGFAIVLLTGVLSPAGTSARQDKKSAFFCPVVGLPDSKACCCPSGYCPLTPKEAITLEHQGAKLQFCCNKCKKMFQESPAKYIAGANHQLVVTKQARQEKCPLSGSTTDSALVTEIAGVKVSFCSEECRKKVNSAAPAERVNLVFGAQAFVRGFGMTVEPKK